MTDIIKIEHLFKSYGEINAVWDLSFNVKKGELFAFLGINGAGKSTTINIFCGVLKKDGGNVEIDGFHIDKSPSEVKRKLGVVFQNSALDKVLSVYDNLESRGALYGISEKALKTKIRELAALLDFEDLLERPVGKLSGGQVRRIDIARALIHDPKILILDEPTTGLDPQTRKKIWKVIEKLRNEKKMTVFLTTHYMEEASEADRVLIIDGGKVSAFGTPIELKNEYTSDHITLYGLSSDEKSTLGHGTDLPGGGYMISVPNTKKATDLILKHPYIFRDYEIVKGTMDDVFLSVTGKKLLGGEDNENPYKA